MVKCHNVVFGRVSCPNILTYASKMENEFVWRVVTMMFEVSSKFLTAFSEQEQVKG